MAKFLSINEAVRAVLDKRITAQSLDPDDYPYSSDSATSLIQVAKAFNHTVPEGQPEIGAVADAIAVALGYYD